MASPPTTTWPLALGQHGAVVARPRVPVARPQHLATSPMSALASTPGRRRSRWREDVQLGHRGLRSVRSCRPRISIMVNVRPAFLTLPERAGKPRRRGITHVLDKGMPASEVDALLQVCGPYVDVWKLGWGTAYLDPGLEEKLALLDQHGVLACTGGTLLEVAWQQGVVDEYLDWAAAAGFPCVEVSCGVVNMTRDAEARADRGGGASASSCSARSARRTRRVEVDRRGVGAGGRGRPRAPGRPGWSPRAGRAARSGLYDPDGEVRADVVEAVVAAIGVDGTVFEAPAQGPAGLADPPLRRRREPRQRRAGRGARRSRRCGSGCAPTPSTARRSAGRARR